MAQLKNFICLIPGFLLLTACSTVQHAPANPGDPFESLNRQSFQFNEDFDRVFFKPVAEVYQKIMPWPVRNGVSNFFSNLNEIPTVGNDLLQVNPYQALQDSWRFAINSTVGIGGILDVATKLGLPKHTQDFGLTLARWGWKESAYVVLPFIGPSTVRDTFGWPINYYGMTVFPWIDWQYRYPILTLDVVNYRASLLSAEDVVETAALDPYVFFRDAYLQRRAKFIAHNDDTALENADFLGGKKSQAENTTSSQNSNDDILQGIDLDADD